MFEMGQILAEEEIIHVAVLLTTRGIVRVAVVVVAAKTLGE